MQRRSPLIFLPIRSAISEHGPQSPKHLEQVLLVYAFVVGDTKNRFDNFRISPTPMQLGLPLLQAAPGLAAILLPLFVLRGHTFYHTKLTGKLPFYKTKTPIHDCF